MSHGRRTPVPRPWPLATAFAEHFGGEGFEGGSFLPGIEREGGFAAGLFQEGDAVPATFDRNLRQQESAQARCADQQTVTAYLYGIGKNGPRGREDAEFYLQPGRLVELHGIEASVFEGGGAGGFRHGAIKRGGGKHVSDTAAQRSTEVKRSEYATQFGKMRGGRIEREIPWAHSHGDDGHAVVIVARQP